MNVRESLIRKLYEIWVTIIKSLGTIGVGTDAVREKGQIPMVEYQQSIEEYWRDKLLKQVAVSLNVVEDEAKSIARVGGDEFVLLFGVMEDENRIIELAEKILQKLESPICLSEQEVIVTGSIGICRYPDDGESEDILLKHADIAMYRAKKKGRNTYQFYDAGMAGEILERAEIERELKNLGGY